MLRSIVLAHRHRAHSPTGASPAGDADVHLAASSVRARLSLGRSCVRGQLRGLASASTSTQASPPSAAPEVAAAPSAPKQPASSFIEHGQRFSILGKSYTADAWTNVSPSILSKTERRLHLEPNHPLGILKGMIEQHLAKTEPGIYKIVDSMNPVVTTVQNFDDLLITKDHPGRQRTDTYYVDADRVLRTHTSAHQSEVLKGRSADGYLLSADVYRRDEIDVTHYPVFHQMEGIRTFDRKHLASASLHESIVPLLATSPAMASASKTVGLTSMDEVVRLLGASDANPIQPGHTSAEAAFVGQHLKTTLETLIRSMMGNDPNLQLRWIDAYFPFTSPSWELEVFHCGKWLELFGCGIIQQQIMDASGNSDRVGWAFGLGLERIAMRLFDIQDIRLFWSSDQRFTSQFKAGRISRFVPFSKYPACYKDVSFWTPPSFHENDFMEVVREVAGDMAEEVLLVDQFTHPKTNRVSRCYRINYRSMERTFTNAEVDFVQNNLRETVAKRCGVELR
ncbi:hypothetical protein BC831DRAFT_471269 [Entophlyctis helioformis]|nr:hypothetical protein BC831DRAFT_471269 [Entophlyctis helioformis]